MKKPELKGYLNQNKLRLEIEAAYKHENHEIVYEFVSTSAKKFEEDLVKYYDRKAIREGDYLEEDIILIDDIEDLGF